MLNRAMLQTGCCPICCCGVKFSFCATHLKIRALQNTIQQVSQQEYSPHWKTMATYQIVRSYHVSSAVRSISDTVIEWNPRSRRKLAYIFCSVSRIILSSDFVKFGDTGEAFFISCLPVTSIFQSTE